MPKPAKKDPGFIDGPGRCQACNTVLTLYPNNFADCPHCGLKICRTCWGDNWATRSFSGENCTHITGTARLGADAIVGKARNFQWDWRKAFFVSVLAALAVGILLFLSNLFIF